MANIERDDIGQDNFQRYNFETLESAKRRLESEHKNNSQITRIFEALLEKEKSPQELSDELEIEENSIRYLITELKDDELAYSGGSQNSTKFYGLSVEELHDGDYIQGLD